MSFRTLFTIVTVAMLSLIASQSAFGQGLYRGRSDNPNGPTVSPYLNLLQNNNPLSPATNYQSLVRPLVDQRAAINQQGGAIQRLQQGASGSYGGQGTGHHSYFMYFSHFYPSATGR